MTPFIDEKVAYDKLAENIQRYNDTKLIGYMPEVATVSFVV